MPAHRHKKGSVAIRVADAIEESDSSVPTIVRSRVVHRSVNTSARQSVRNRVHVDTNPYPVPQLESHGVESADPLHGVDDASTLPFHEDDAGDNQNWETTRTSPEVLDGHTRHYKKKSWRVRFFFF